MINCTGRTEFLDVYIQRTVTSWMILSLKMYNNDLMVTGTKLVFVIVSVYITKRFSSI